ncbi:MAG: hypothetical protein ACREJX_21120, partial [Polyangiaceae bacterium]
RARVHNGRLVLDAPTDLPEGTEVELLLADRDDLEDDLDDEERARLHRELDLAGEEIARGEGIPAQEVLAELRRMR